MSEHRWSGWPGAWCLDCGREDPVERAMADGVAVEDLVTDPKDWECPEPGSRRHDPYAKE